MANQVGVYMVKHKDGHFYIGSSKELGQRWHIHKSRLKAGVNNKKIQEHYDKTGSNINDFVFEIVETCREKSLQRKEEALINKHWGNPLLLNSRKDGTTGKRGITTSKEASYKIANELLGKNTKDGKIHRPANLTFVAPDGTEYDNIQSVKAFAKEHGLSQSSMCQLSNGWVDIVNGWTLKDNPNLPDIGRIIDLWPESRIREYYKEYHILTPTNKLVKTFYLWQYEQDNNCSVILNDLRDRWVSRNTYGLDDDGRGYREVGVPTYTIVWKGKTYNNILSVPKFSHTHDIRLDRMRSYLNNPPIYKRSFHIEKELQPIY